MDPLIYASNRVKNRENANKEREQHGCKSGDTRKEMSGREKNEHERCSQNQEILRTIKKDFGGGEFYMLRSEDRWNAGLLHLHRARARKKSVDRCQYARPRTEDSKHVHPICL